MSAVLRRAEVQPLHRPRSSCAWLPEKRRAHIVLEGDVSGPDYVGLMRQLLAAHPEAALHDWVFDLRAYHGSIRHDHVEEIASLYHSVARGRDDRAITVLVTPDRGFVHWAVLLRVQFRPRRFEVVQSMNEAEAMLSAPEW
ncbi:hypothetical protein [Sabulicella glaciei]|uniref:STAS/SEC14 domain-containing protein n=1 Tax=Sabulicella glaciei TaxID=2984948 RepID=A0ABT3P0D2_9PROT|nr:hypothetical protein [Roseococcus sp. MDT2-1-1]MCW8087873.1 hypothetical protein [Roseococcus sp. MDT2-1-1]